MEHASLIAVLLAAASALPAAAQGFDCTKARSPVEQAICATPALVEQDRALSDAYVATLARDPARAAALRTEQRAWLAERARICSSKNEPPPRVAACLAGLYRSRLLALAGAGAPPAASPPATPPARPATAAGGPPPGPAASPPVAIAAAQILPGVTAPPVPALPARAEDPAATLRRETAPAGGRTDVLLDVKVPGRFSVRAESRTGVALQLVDMIAGPGDQTGEPGIKDGRIDALLDRGSYKLRVVGADKATGDAKLIVTPFREAEAWSTTLVRGGQISADLADGLQRSFWLQVEKGGRVSVEAVGRSLADLRLWRNGRDLAALEPAMDRVTPRSGHPMSRARIDGEVEPGLYLATVYGGPRIAWSDNDLSQPLHVRAGVPEPLSGGIVDGTVGPAGSMRFEAPPAATSFRLELPEPAPATLRARRGMGAAQSRAIAKNSREPAVSLDLTASGGQPATLEVSGLEGQPFRLRALDPSTSRRVSGVGPHWVAVDAAGEGGDEPPATALLAQFEVGMGGRVLASNAPQIGPGKAWRSKLNFRGATSLIFEATASMPVAVSVVGPRLTAKIEPLLGNRPPRTDGRTPRFDLEPGWYVLKLEPQGGAFGIADVTLGPPGLAGEAPKPQAARPSIPFGIQNLERGGNYQIFTNEAPGLVLAPVSRALPANLEAAPFAVAQAAGQSLDLPVRIPATGGLAATAANGVPVPVTLVNDVTTPAGRNVTIRLPAPERTRIVVLSWLDPARRTAILPPLPPGEAETIAAATPRFFDLARNEQKSFAVDVPEGGLYRVETLGRLKTSLTVATSFLPRLDAADANGAGQNALAQTYLRAGRYNVAVKSSESAGRVGLVARVAALPDGGLLRPETSARATLADGRGVTFPIEIAEAGRYRLELFSLGDPLRARLEDAEGWPLTVPGPLTSLERRFEPGRYRLVVLPEAVEARVVARLSRIMPAAELAGHGPHRLPFDQDVAFQWREPAVADEARTPDSWEFALAAPADVTLTLSEGMSADLMRSGEQRPVGRVVGKAGYSGRLPAGRYMLEARSLGRNDRLDYKVSLTTKEIQPGAPRRVELPATVPFALAEDRVVSLTSFGRRDLRGVLKDADGRVVERLDDRADDWNIALSRALPAGAYTLELTALPAPPGAKPKQDGGNAEGAGVTADDGPSAEPDGDEPAAATGDGEAAAPGATPASDADEEDEDNEPAADTRVEIRLALPDISEHPALAGEGEQVFEGGAVHRAALPPPARGSLLLLAARSANEIVLSLERQNGSGRWDVVGFERGPNPLVAAPGDGDATRPWRLSAWTVDDGPARIAVAIRAIHREPAEAGVLSFDPVPLAGVGADVGVDLVAAPAAGVLAFERRGEPVLEGSRPGQALAPAGDTIVPQSDAVWLVKRGRNLATLKAQPAALPVNAMALTVPAGGRATWPKAAIPAGTIRLWRADSTFGQPGLAAGRGQGIADGSAIALAGDEALRVWNAGGEDALPVRISAQDLALRPEARTDREYAASLPRGTAQPLGLPAGRKRLALDLAPGSAAILEAADGSSATIWAGAAALSRSLSGEWTNVVLANLAAGAAPVRIAVAPAGDEPIALGPDVVLKRFVGAAGSLAVRIAGEPGDRLVTLGGAATFLGADGRIQRGAALTLAGPGELVLDHGPGLVAAWLERAGRSPWPDPPSRAVALPSSTRLEGGAMTLALTAAEPVLLHARTTAPVIVALRGAGTLEQPVMYPAGAELHRLLTAGEAELRLYSPQDGPLTGTLELTSSPVRRAGEGLGEAIALAPGGAALFGFEVKRPSQIGIGLRAEPDSATARLLDAAGKVVGSGIAQMQRLEPGRYVLEASAPAEGRTVIVRPALVGLDPPPAGPPAEVVRDYLQSVGLAPTNPGR